MDEVKKLGNIRIYNIGGSGLNIGSNVACRTDLKEFKEGFANILPCYIDSSTSNLNDSINQDELYLINGVDGSGKKRSMNYESFVDSSKEIIHQFKPETINIVLHSAGGGTGSVLGPIIVSELLKKDEMVIVALVGSNSTKIEAENTSKTLKSYKLISEKTGKAVNVCYKDNSAQGRPSVDMEMEMLISVLALVCSGKNKELDTADIYNFLNYDKVTSYHPSLNLIDAFKDDITLDKGMSLISLATITTLEKGSDSKIPVEYQAVGYWTKNEDKVPTIPLHVAIISGYFNKVIDVLDSVIKQHNEIKSTVIEKSIISDNDKGTSEGIIL